MAVTLNASTSSGLVQTADTSGTVEIQSNGSTKLTVSSTGAYGQVVSGTAVASTSGTSIDFTSIPSWVKKITVMLSGVSTSGTSNPILQVGTSSGVTTSGYVGTGSECGSSTNATSFTAGFGIRSALSTNTIQGIITLCCLNSSTNVWVASGVTAQPSSAFTHQIAGTVTLAATLDRVRITTVGGTDTFDAGTINILYEG